MKAFHQETRIQRHRTWVRWIATAPFLLAYAGGLLYFMSSTVPKWVDFTMIGVGATLGLFFMLLSCKHLAIAPFVYRRKEDPDHLIVNVDHGNLWDKALHRPITWQHVVRILPGVYLLVGDTFKAPTSELERCTELFHLSPDEVDDETDPDD